MEESRIEKIISILRENYPSPKTALSYRTPFQLLIATVLSSQCTDERVNKVTETLFKKYPTIEDFARIDSKELEKDIYSTGFYRNKAKNIVNLSRHIIEDFEGKTPQTMEKLTSLPGVGRKTANIVLSSAYKKGEGIAVDVHVRRVSQRIGLSKQKNPEKIEKDLMRIIPKKDWIDINYLLVDHGRRVCTARRPKCPECPLRKLCPSSETLCRLSENLPLACCH